MRAGVLKRSLILVVFFAGAVAVSYIASLYREYTRPGAMTQETVVVIAPGTSAWGIANALQASGVIADRCAFFLAILARGVDNRLKAGEYAFPPAVSPQAALQRIIDHRTLPRFFAVPEGLTSAEIRARLARLPGLSGDSEIPIPEGTLHPETYRYAYGDSYADLVARMRRAQQTLLETLWAARQPDLPLQTPEEAVTLASIVEAEAARADERAHIAGVFINRLRRGMPLQADPTVIFALTDGQRPLGRALTRRDWRVPHPYNTYVNTGLPPGPINHPGEAALRAVLHPQDTKYLFFVAAGRGGHLFSATLEAHNRNIASTRR